MPKLLRLFKKTSLIFLPECGPSNLTKSTIVFFNSQLSEIQ